MAPYAQRHEVNHPATSDSDYHEPYLQILQDLVHDADTLSKQGYPVAPLTALDFEGLKRCAGCKKRM